MIDQPFRAVLPQFVQPVLKIYRQARLTPNHITAIGLGFAACSAVAIGLQLLWLAIALWWIGRFFDGTDGIYARTYKMQSPFGAYWDFLADMLAYSVMLIGFSVAFPQYQMSWLVIAIGYILCSTTALSYGQHTQASGSDQDNRGLKLAAGLVEGGETGIAYTCFLIFPENLPLLISCWICLLAATVVVRTRLAFLTL